MEKFIESRFVESLSRFGSRVEGNTYVQGISQGIMLVLPIIIIGSFASLFAGLRLDAWQNFISSTGLNTALTMLANATTNMLGVFFTFGITKSLSEKFELSGKIIPLYTVIAYFTLLPITVNEQGIATLSYDFLGTYGMIVGIMLSIFVVKFYRFVEQKKITIKMPEGTPSYVASSFESLIPGFLIMGLVIVIRLLIMLTPYGNLFNLLYSLLQIPITAIVGGSVMANIFIRIIIQIFWALGIHPGFIQSLISPILFSLDGANQAAFASQLELPNVIGMAFSYITTTAVLFPAIAVSILIFAKSKRLKSIGKISIAPAIFGISEPLIFGLPIVFNPIIWIPWIIAPSLNFAIGYFATLVGWVDRTAGVTVFNFPMIVTGIMNGSFSIAILEIVLFVMNLLLFAPFIIIVDKGYRKEETKDFKEKVGKKLLK